MHYLATVNFAQTVDHMRSEPMRGFVAVTPAVYAQAAKVEGHVASAFPVDERTDLSFFERDWGRWGPFTVPHYYVGGRGVDSVFEASALSVWQDIKALHSFVYAGLHLRAIKRKAAWFSPMTFPGYAMWWCTEWPTWSEGARRLEHLADNSDSPFAFTFRRLFDPAGNSLKLSAIAEH